MTSARVSPFGTRIGDRGETTFRLWAPGQASVSLALGAGQPVRHPMQAGEDGWHRVTLDDAGAGSRYAFVVGDGMVVPDPASRFNPDDVHAPSEVIDPAAYAWQDGAWRGRPWHEAVIYELHVGTFTAEGTFAAAAARLGHLVELGITAVELLPLADFPGRRNWGYDGVLPFAPDATYGTPDELKAFVDRAHGLGLMVLLDVVYNHFGPDGNYLHAYCPEFFNPRHQTPWGAAINFDGPHCRTVRDFYIHNALHWIQDHHFDGLRVDAVHEIADDSACHIVREIAEALRDGPGRDRHVHLVLENDRNEASLLGPSGDFRAQANATAQWNDDLHHAAHALLTGETDSYYVDFADAPADRFACGLAEGYVYQGQASPFRGGASRGEPSLGLRTTAFVSFLQNHDQIGNRAFGERIDRLAPAGKLDAAYACLLLSPHVPMLFMGEEFASASPFLYFCDFEGELAAAVTEGRRKEFAHAAAFADPSMRERIPDPNAVTTFEASKLRWSELGLEYGPHRHRLDLIRRLLDLRRRHLVPLLESGTALGTFSSEGAAIAVAWPLADGSRWRLHANFGDMPLTIGLPAQADPVYLHAAAASHDGGVVLGPDGVWIGRSPS